MATAIVLVLLVAAGCTVPAARDEVRLAAGQGETSTPAPARTAPPGTAPFIGLAEPATSTALAAPTTSAAESTEPSPARAAVPELAGPVVVEDPVAFAARIGEVDWEVLSVGSTPDPSTGGHVAVDQGAVDERWEGLGMHGPAPVLPAGTGALLVPIGGSCDGPSRVHGVEGLVDVDTREVVAAVRLDPGCADLERDGTGVGPPRTLYVIGVPLDIATRLGGVTTVVGSLANISWEVLAVVAVHGPGTVGPVDDQAQLDGIWLRYGPPGPAPRLPEGRAGFVAGVPGHCAGAGDVLALDAGVVSNEGASPSPVGVVTFDGSCAEPLGPGPADWQQGTMYVLTLSPEVSRSLDGSRVLVADRDPARAPVDAYAAHPAVVAAGIGGVDWEVVAIGETPHPSLSGDVVTDQAGVDDRWRYHRLPGDAPVLPDRRGALFVPVPGTCDQPAAVRSIDAMPDGGQTAVLGMVHVDDGCAQSVEEALAQPGPRALYVITVTLDVAEQLASVGALPAEVLRDPR